MRSNTDEGLYIPVMDTGFWGRRGMELEPGRCRRTDGKKWRCARDVVAGHKYCDRHMHRGRSRSRKPVELSTPNTAASRSRATTFLAAAVPGDATRFGFSESSNPSTIQLLQPNHSPLETKPEHKGLLQAPNGANRSDGHILRPFFDDWPRSQKIDNSNGSNTGPINSGTALSISMPGNLSSDVSLKLCTGNGEELRLGDNGREPQGWGGGWTANQVASMGGPLAEALRSSTNSSPTSVLHQLARGSASETGYVGA